MELGQWVQDWIIENLNKSDRKSDNRVSTAFIIVIIHHWADSMQNYSTICSLVSQRRSLSGSNLSIGFLFWIMSNQ